jgi:hypothetical protein
MFSSHGGSGGGGGGVASTTLYPRLVALSPALVPIIVLVTIRIILSDCVKNEWTDAATTAVVAAAAAAALTRPPSHPCLFVMEVVQER